MIIINKKALIISILIPNILGFITSLVTNIGDNFEQMIKPAFSPPSIIFPIVWIILYTLMGISAYIIYQSNNKEKNKALTVYGIQLIINYLWTIFFFNLKWYLFSFIWIIIIIILVIIMMYQFYKINKTASLIQIPYLLWLIFASILNYYIWLLN